MLWIHGGSVEDSSMMVPDLEPFFGRIRALFPDTRGHGLSSRFERPEDYTYAKKFEDVILWLDALGIERAVWGGASMGAALSLWAAVHAPARVRGVVSISGPPYPAPPADKAWWAAHRPLVEAGRFEEYFDANVRLRMGEAALARLKARPERYAEVTAHLREHSVPSLLALLDETFERHDWLADCARIRCPVQVIAGSEDRFPTVAMSRRLVETIPGARFHVVEGGPHFPNRSHRAEVQGVIEAFLASLGI
ncbi:MAG TPA: alpha/beta hydrolase [Candidatus Bathyarchaeia archaeon]|nr:alpha/beta hydrolase [Candidatus Bathyarchaeia archaeon]